MAVNTRRIILFSTPTDSNRNTILNLLFSNTIKNKVFAYMPSDGANNPQKYTDIWKGFAQKYGAEFNYIDNSKKDASEDTQKLLRSNILLITGGNTFKLLYLLKRSGLDKAVIEFSKKDEFVMAGFSAGALVMTPNINICSLSYFDPNEVEISDLSALSIVNYEVFPHFDDSKKNLYQSYQSTTNNIVKKIGEDEYILEEL